MNENFPRVSAIIPTFKRPDLVLRAVQSVLTQTYPNMEAVVIIDGTCTETRDALAALRDPRVSVIETGQNVGPAMARNAGVKVARGQYLALLDDDDEWTLDKIKLQMALVTSKNLTGDFIVSSRIAITTGTDRVVSPERLYEPSMDLSEYLFDRPTPSARPGIVGSGTPLFPRALALRIPFPDDGLHEDLAWILRCVTLAHVPLFMIPQVGHIYYLSASSLNQTKDWQTSLAWAREYRANGCLSDRAFAGLLATTTAWRAKRKVGLKAMLKLASVMRAEGQPSVSHWLSWMGITALPLGLMDTWRQHRR